VTQQRRPLRCALSHDGGKSLLRRLAEEIRVTGPSKLLMGLGKHSDH
jgi:hypothetical protein